MSEPEHILDHAGRAFGRLMQQFQEVPDWRILTDIFGRQIQAIEDAYWQLLTERWLAGEGAQLDQLGNLLNEPRAGFADEPYLERLKAKILILRSSGSPLNLIKIFKRLLPANTIKFTSMGGASFILNIGIINPAFTEIYQRFLRQAKSGGINAQIEFTTVADEFLFIYNNMAGTYPIGLGYSDTAGSGGGQYSGASA